MKTNLVIVESPAKAKTIEKFLDESFLVTSSYGHIRDLAKKNLGIELDKGYNPLYTIPDDKKRVVNELKRLSKTAETVWLASDEDREGEAIAWHIAEVLKLDTSKTKRIVFHEITKTAIQQAVKNPRIINQNLVNAQQARRVLDRIVGFELSPVLWKKIKGKLSAGRVQSVAVRFLVERERDIINFKNTSYFRINGNFLLADNTTKLEAELNRKMQDENDTFSLLEKCKVADYSIKDITVKPSKRTPSAPFTTSTLQQEASRKLGFPVARTMSVAQKLYEAGFITYMRTDSVNLAESAINETKAAITQLKGSNYVKIRHFKTKIKGAQESHEAIRPTYIKNKLIGGSQQEKKLYELIWKRTIASQMADAKLEKTTVKIGISNLTDHFIATGEVIKFDGFLSIYIESTDDETELNETTKGLLPPLKANDPLELDKIIARERFTQHPPRYTEASLVKKLEEMGVGRPSTYAPTISTIQNREYVVKEERTGIQRTYTQFSLTKNEIKKEVKNELTGAEKNKLYPTDIGMVVNDFLIKHFDKIMNYNFTADIEKELDNIAFGKIKWNGMIDNFYKTFHPKVEEVSDISERETKERVLGKDPKTGKDIIVRIGRYGPLAQIGTAEDENEKPKFASLKKGQYIESITLEEASELFKLPRDIGEYENKKVVIGIGRFGPYIRHDAKFVSIPKDIDPLSIELQKTIELIEEKKEKDRNKIVKNFEENDNLQILNGRWGAYIAFNKKNYRIPKEHKEHPDKLSYQDCMKIVNNKDK